MASKLQDLINRLCPNGVEYRRLGEVFTRLRGTPITAGKMKEIAASDGEIRIFAGGKTVVDAHESDIPHANITRTPAVLVQSRGVIDFVYCDRPFTFKNEMWAYTADDSRAVKFLYYVLQNNSKFFRESASGMGALPQISLRVTEDFLIPVPPLEVQSEIVQILDNFAELTAELTAELEKRKKQYEHYRRALLCGVESSELRVESSGWPMVKLGDVCEMKAGKAIAAVNISAELDEQHPVACYGANGFRGYVAEPNQDGDHCIIGRQGALCGNVCFASGRFYATEHAVVVTQLGKYDDRYLYHMLTEMDLNQYKSQGAQPGLSVGKLEELSIPLPPLAEQRRIVSILDRFDRLCNDLSSGLPAEIAARKKQYAYYRDKLLELRVGS